MSSIKHEVWQEVGGETMLCYAGELGKQARLTLEPKVKLIHTFYASSHYEAMTIYYQFMDWGIYTTDFEVDKEPYKF
jgi:hypothetical protein